MNFLNRNFTWLNPHFSHPITMANGVRGHPERTSQAWGEGSAKKGQKGSGGGGGLSKRDVLSTYTNGNWLYLNKLPGYF